MCSQTSGLWGTERTACTPPDRGAVLWRRKYANDTIFIVGGVVGWRQCPHHEPDRSSCLQCVTVRREESVGSAQRPASLGPLQESEWNTEQQQHHHEEEVAHTHRVASWEENVL